MYQLPILPYNQEALSPAIDEATMALHYGKHHQTYCDKLNLTLEKYPALALQSAEDLIKDLNQLPEDIKQSVRNFGGGYINHNLFWRILAPVSTLGQENKPQGELAKEIDRQFGSFAEFQKLLNEQALNLFGSGWAWLVLDAERKLAITTTINQDSPLINNQIPLLTIDVWEHAYYLKYQNRRGEYLQALWSIFNWSEVGQNYTLALNA